MSENPQVPNRPQWETEFPIDRLESVHVSRREFAKYLALLSGGLCAGSGALAVKDKLFPKHKIQGEEFVCLASEVPLGGTRAFTLPGSKVPYILIHLETDEWRAFEQKCTHLSCAVFYSPTAGKIQCPCHNGWFDARTGAVLQGPPPRPLPQLRVTQRGDKLFVSESDNQTSQTA